MNNKILALLLVMGVVVITSCKKSFLNLNNDPNYPSSVPVSKLLPSALVETGALMVDPNMDIPNIWMGIWSYGNGVQFPTEYRDYAYPNSSGNTGFFANAYTNAYDYQQIITLSQQQGNPAYEGMARIMKDMIMQMLVDVYNDVPYTQAFQGVANQTPKYDSGIVIYDSLYEDLSRAITLLNSATSSQFPSSSVDIMFQGSKAEWVALANTVKLKLLIRQSTRADRQAYIQSKLADFPNGTNSFLKGGQLAMINPGYTNSSNQQSPFWTNFGYQVSLTPTNNLNQYCGGSYIGSFLGLSNQNDPRLWYIMSTVDPTNPLQYAPPAGTDPSYLDTLDFSSIGAGYLYFSVTEMGTAPYAHTGYTLPATGSLICDSSFALRTVSDNAMILSDFESLFLQAEAVQRGWFSTTDAQTLFDSAVGQSFTYEFDANPNFGGAGAGAQLFQPIVNPTADNTWGGGDDPIQLIITQKYIALASINLIEPWTEYRRTGWPAVPLSSNIASASHIPYRYLYPQREYTVNGASVAKEGTVTQNSKIWWMQ